MRNAVVAILLMLAVSAKAQTEPEYRLEIGGGIGMVSYQGDFNGNLFKNMQPMFSLLGKYKFNPRMALAMNISYGTLKGSAKMSRRMYQRNGPTTRLKRNSATWVLGWNTTSGHSAQEWNIVEPKGLHLIYF